MIWKYLSFEYWSLSSVERDIYDLFLIASTIQYRDDSTERDIYDLVLTASTIQYRDNSTTPYGGAFVYKPTSAIEIIVSSYNIQFIQDGAPLVSSGLHLDRDTLFAMIKRLANKKDRERQAQIYSISAKKAKELLRNFK